MGFAEYTDYDATGLADLIRRGEVGAREVVDEAISRIEAHNPLLNAVVIKLFDRALARVEHGPNDGPFGGVPFLLKDLGAEYAQAPLTMGSRSMSGFIPGWNATIVDRFEAAGFVVLGRTATPEFGLAPVTEPELYGVTANPWNRGRTAGGSSGGAGAAVAAGMVPAAHASDGGGSIRIPASVNGLFGLKPSRGRVPTGPILGESWFGLSSGHALTRSARDSAGILDAIAGFEPGDPYTAPVHEGSFRAQVDIDPPSLCVALSTDPLLGETMEEECRVAVHETGRLLESLGHRVSYVEVPVQRAAWMEAFLTLAAASTAQAISETTRMSGKSKPDPKDYELLTWILGAVGRHLSAENLAAALTQVRMAGRDMGRFHRQFDLLVTPTLARVPWRHGDLAPSAIERRMLETLRRSPVGPALLALYRQLSKTVTETIPNTPLFNMTGQPAMSVPLHTSADGLPVGVQFVAPYGADGLLFQVAGQLERARPWFDRRPPGY
ncbi:MAG: amidase [Acidimicrobiia bacterium]